MIESRILAKGTIPEELEEKIVSIVSAKKALSEQEAEVKEELLIAMEKYGVKNAKGQQYSIILGRRINYKPEDLKKVTKTFIKETLDTDKISDFIKVHGRVPAHIQKSETKYVTWKEQK